MRFSRNQNGKMPNEALLQYYLVLSLYALPI